MKVRITQNDCVIKLNGVPVVTRTKKFSLLYLNVKIEDEFHVAKGYTELLHRILGHASYDAVSVMVMDGGIAGDAVSVIVMDGGIDGVKIKADGVCDVCATSKQVRKKHSR